MKEEEEEKLKEEGEGEEELLPQQVEKEPARQKLGQARSTGWAKSQAVWSIEDDRAETAPPPTALIELQHRTIITQ